MPKLELIINNKITDYYKSGRNAAWLSGVLSMLAMIGSTIILPVLIYEMDGLQHEVKVESTDFKVITCIQFKSISLQVLI